MSSPRLVIPTVIPAPRVNSVPPISTVLIANRGEIAVRIIRTLRTLGITSVAVFSEADSSALHVRMADRAIPIGRAPSTESYLCADAVISAALAAGADAVHPGYGFLSENAEFARECERAGLIFIGPPADAIAAMGDKIAARHTVAAAGVPVVPGVGAPGMSDAELIAAAADIGFPILIKPSAGGGGKGMRPVAQASDLPGALSAARREAVAAFGDDTLLLERLISRPRHIEIQVLFDAAGNAVHLGERECSLQRRHQKIIEEAPSILLDAVGRERLGSLAVQAGRACGYVNAGTVEFICSSDAPDEAYFMEMNTRLQVEHPVTEQVWGLDLVAEQIRVAAGQELGYTQGDLRPVGHAIEARVYAEDPFQNFMPSPGRIAAIELGEDLPGIRVDSGVEQGDEIPSHYDPMIAKIIGTGADRAEALQHLHAALLSSRVVGVASNLGFLGALVGAEAVIAGDLHTEFVDEFMAAAQLESAPPAALIAIAALGLHLWPGPGEQTAVMGDPWADRSGWRIGVPAETKWRIAVPGAPGVVDLGIAAGSIAQDATVVVGITRRVNASSALRRSDGRRYTDYDVRLNGGDPMVVTAELAQVDVAAGTAVMTALINGVSWSAVIDRDEVNSSESSRTPGLWISQCGVSWFFGQIGLNDRQQLGLADTSGVVTSPMPGTVVAVMVRLGETVVPGQPIAVVEAMKMEHTLKSGVDGVVVHVGASAGDRVARGDVLVQIQPQAIAPLEHLPEQSDEGKSTDES
jgi:acetyl-CoA/propionyl-CoA carboxylase, biotin carboxylase, biotin carboxyl carrier protein